MYKRQGPAAREGEQEMAREFRDLGSNVYLEENEEAADVAATAADAGTATPSAQ